VRSFDTWIYINISSLCIWSIFIQPADDGYISLSDGFIDISVIDLHLQVQDRTVTFPAIILYVAVLPLRYFTFHVPSNLLTPFLIPNPVHPPLGYFHHVEKYWTFKDVRSFDTWIYINISSLCIWSIFIQPADDGYISLSDGFIDISVIDLHLQVQDRTVTFPAIILYVAVLPLRYFTFHVPSSLLTPSASGIMTLGSSRVVASFPDAQKHAVMKRNIASAILYRNII